MNSMSYSPMAFLPPTPIENSRFACGSELEISPPDTQECSGSGRQAFVAMVQAAHLRDRDDLPLARTLHRSRFRGIFVQAQMSPTPMIIGEISFEQTIQVSLVEHDDVIQTFAADRTNQPFDVRRLPRRTRRNPDFLQAQSLGAALELQAVNAIAVPEQVLRGRCKGEGFSE